MKSGVLFGIVALSLMMSISFVSAGILCEWFGIFCEDDSHLKGELYQGSPGGGGVGLISHWKFEDNYEDSVGRNHGIPSDTPPGDPGFREGKIGKAVNFDGNDYVKISREGFSNMNSISVAAWIKIDDLTRNEHIFSRYGPINYDPFKPGIQFSLYHIKKNLVFFINGGGSSNGIYATGNQLTNGWHHVVGVFDGNTKDHKVFIDGVLVGQRTYSVNLINPDFDLIIGDSNFHVSSQKFKGDVDELKIWDKALSYSEVLEEYVGESGGSGMELVCDGGEDLSLKGISVIRSEELCIGSECVNGENCYYTAGEFGSGIMFDGIDDYIDLGDVDIRDEITISFWIKDDRFNVPYGNEQIISKRGQGDRVNYAVDLAESDNELRFYIKVKGVFYVWNTNSANLKRSEWQHVVVTYDEDVDPVFYVDGKIVDSYQGISPNLGTGTPAMPLNSDNTLIGAYNNAPSKDYLEASLDDIIIMQGILNSNQVQNLYLDQLSKYGCTDSDGGLNYNERGYIMNNSKAEKEYDRCVNEERVLEKYCEDNKGNEKTFFCPNGCDDGACITTQCSDGLDNDEDGFIDLDDSDCEDANDESEFTGCIDDSCSIDQCRDGIDNDGDGGIDFPNLIIQKESFVNSLQGPPEHASGNAQPPTVVVESGVDFLSNSIITVSGITGSFKTPITYQCTDTTFPMLIAFYDDQNNLIGQEYNLAEFTNVDVPENAKYLYSYIREGNKYWYIDNIGGTGCTFIVTIDRNNGEGDVGCESPEDYSEFSGCTDSDGGRDYLIRGSSCVDGYCSDDICLIDGNLQEYYCTEDNINILNEIILCPKGCVNGACITGPCSGCLIEDGLSDDNTRCVPFGFRLNFESEKEYCDIDGNFYTQKNIDDSCVNNFECTTNQCSNDLCVGLIEEVRAQTSIIIKIWCKITNLFDEEGYEACLNELS